MSKNDFPWISRQAVRLLCLLVFVLGRGRRFAPLFRLFADAGLKRYRDSLSGTFPVQVEKGVLFLSCDEAYYRQFGAHLVNSALKHAGGFNVHLHVNRLSRQFRQELQALAQASPGGLLSFTGDDLEFEHLSGSARWYYLASVRFVRLYQLVQTCRAPVLSLDADGVVVKSLQPRFAQMAGHDAGIYLRLGNTLDWRKVLASALFIMPSELGERFIRDVALVIAWLLRRKLPYHIDQLVIFYLWRVYAAREREFRVAPLSRDMADWECGEDSYIWSAKGDRKYLSREFLGALEH
jgi:hypothetical protein